MISRSEADAILQDLYISELSSELVEKAADNGLDTLSNDELRDLCRDLYLEIIEANHRARNLGAVLDYVVDRTLGLKFG